MNQKGFTPILVAIGMIIILGLLSGAYYLDIIKAQLQTSQQTITFESSTPFPTSFTTPPVINKLITPSDTTSLRTYPEVLNYPFLTVTEIYNQFWKDSSFAPGYYNTEGYIQEIGCKSDPCLGDTITISEDTTTKINPLHVIVDQSNQFQKGMKYRFSLEMVDTINFPKSNPKMSGIKAIYLIGYSKE